MSLYDKIINIHPSLNDKDLTSVGIILQNDGDGDYIAKWEHSTLEKPTDEELEDAE